MKCSTYTHERLPCYILCPMIISDHSLYPVNYFDTQFHPMCLVRPSLADNDPFISSTAMFNLSRNSYSRISCISKQFDPFYLLYPWLHHSDPKTCSRVFKSHALDHKPMNQEVSCITSFHALHATRLHKHPFHFFSLHLTPYIVV